jgi:hypothetical protein
MLNKPIKKVMNPKIVAMPVKGTTKILVTIEIIDTLLKK